MRTDKILENYVMYSMSKSDECERIIGRIRNLDKEDMTQDNKDELPECDNEIEYNCLNWRDMKNAIQACDKANHEFAKSCDYGGYDSEAEFWSIY